jgi:hypothetical protein
MDDIYIKQLIFQHKGHLFKAGRFLSQKYAGDEGAQKQQWKPGWHLRGGIAYSE